MNNVVSRNAKLDQLFNNSTIQVIEQRESLTFWVTLPGVFCGFFLQNFLSTYGMSEI